MGILRVLFVAIVILCIALILLPRTTQDKQLERKLFKILSILCGTLFISFVATLFYFRDTFLSDPTLNDPLLQSIQSNSPSVKTLSLSNYLLRNTDPVSLQSALKHNHTLKEITLDDLSHSDSRLIAESLSHHPTLQKITIRKFSPEALESFFQIPLAPSVKRLIINDHRLKSNLTHSWAHRLKESHLSRLDLKNDQLTDEACHDLAVLLQNNAQLEHLVLSSNQIRGIGIEDFIEAVATHATLKKLDLSQNSIGSAGAKQLSELLKKASSLTVLQLGYNRLNDAAIHEVSQGLAINHSLIRLELQRNPFSDAGAASLAEALLKNQMLQILVIRSKEITPQGKKILLDTLKTFPKRNLEF